jgi:hypothetical protein
MYKLLVTLFIPTQRHVLILTPLQELSGTPLQWTWHTGNDPDVNATDKVIAPGVCAAMHVGTCLTCKCVLLVHCLLVLSHGTARCCSRDSSCVTFTLEVQRFQLCDIHSGSAEIPVV